MASIFNIGRSGLMASKKSLETTGHNIANANTEGYSRQQVHQQTAAPIANGNIVEGTGTQIGRLSRVNDPLIEKRLNSTISNHSYFKERLDQLSQVEDIFNEVDGEGLNKVLNKFFNAFRELANSPENETIRSLVRDSARLVVQDVKRIRESLDIISRTVDRRLEKLSIDTNQSLKQIARLNKRIAELEVSGNETGDLRDQRDLLVRGLSENFAIQSYEDERGNFTINAKGVGTLVTGGQFQSLKVSAVDEGVAKNGMSGAFEIFFSERTSIPIGEKFQKGAFSSLMHIRNQDITEMRDKIDDIAFNLVKMVNAIHSKGFVGRKVDPNQTGDAIGPFTGLNFFKDLKDTKDAALLIDIDDAIKSELSNISTGLAANAPGDNRVALAISKLQHEKVLDNGQKTIEESFLQAIGKIGLASKKARLDASQSEGIKTQLVNLRERISGVSLDEEAANMVRFQHAFDASAKVLQTADEMLMSVLNIKK